MGVPGPGRGGSKELQKVPKEKETGGTGLLPDPKVLKHKKHRKKRERRRRGRWVQPVGLHGGQCGWSP